MKIAIGGFIHEGNSFSVETIGLEKFKEMIYTESGDLVERHRHDRRILGGFIDYAEGQKWEILPLVAAMAVPAGPVKKEAYEQIKVQFCEPLKKENVDGILLHLHGAIVSEEVPDCEGAILTAVRDIVGDEIPMMTVHDLHANVSPAMIHTVNGVFGYNTQPHADMYEREQEAAALMDRILKGEVQTYCAYAQPPLLLPAISTDTAIGAMKPVIEKAFQLEKEDGIFNVSPFAGYYGSDTVNTGASAVFLAEAGKRQRADEIAAEMADYFWLKKDTFFVETVPVKDALKLAAQTERMCVFVDEADDPMGGGPANGTYILSRLLEEGADSVAIMTIFDSEFVELAFQAGEGNEVTGLLGGKRDHKHGEPINVQGKVIKLYEGKIPLVCWNEEALQNPGKIAVVDFKGIHIVVTEHKTSTESINIFKYLGMDAGDYKILVGKGLGEAYQMVFKEMADKFITIDSIGVTNPDVTKIGEFQNIRRPVYPLEPDTKMRYE